MEIVVLLVGNFVCSVVAHPIAIPARMDIRYQSVSVATVPVVPRDVRLARLQCVLSVFTIIGLSTVFVPVSLKIAVPSLTVPNAHMEMSLLPATLAITPIT